MTGTLGIWPVRVQAEALAAQLVRRLSEGELFRPWEHAGSQRTLFQQSFALHSQWILIMATGIAARFVDGLLQNKHHDPAVVVLDEAARYAIALVGGHEGGANALAYRVANALGATPVVTTASEATRPLIIGIGCRKGVTSAQVEAAVLQALTLRNAASPRAADARGLLDAAGLASAAGSTGAVGVEGLLVAAGLVGEGGSISDGGVAGLAISNGAAELVGMAGPCVPRVGVPAVGTPALGGKGVAALADVRELVTVDLKADEPGLVAFSRASGVPLRVIAKHQIEARTWVTKASEWVRQSVGLDGVCEPCALIACPRGRLVVPKTTLDGVAVAIVEDDWSRDP